MDNALSMSSRNEARSNKLAKQLEDKYRNDLVTLEELQSKVVSVTNCKQKEITELENTLKKVKIILVFKVMIRLDTKEIM